MLDQTPNVPPIKGASTWGVSGLQVYGICSRKVVYSEEVEAQSNYKKSFLW